MSRFITYLIRSNYFQLAIGNLCFPHDVEWTATSNERGWQTPFDRQSEVPSPKMVRAMVLLLPGKSGQPKKGFMLEQMTTYGLSSGLGLTQRYSMRYFEISHPEFVVGDPDLSQMREAWREIDAMDMPANVMHVLGKIIDAGQNLTGQGSDFFRYR